MHIDIRYSPEVHYLHDYAHRVIQEGFTGRAAAGHVTALFWNPDADNPDRAWSESAAKRAWMAACKQCEEQISMGEGLRHSVISALAEVLPERPLRAHTRHRDGRPRWCTTSRCRSWCQRMPRPG